MDNDDNEKLRAMEEAMEWLLRLKADQQCPETLRDLDAWLEGSETNRTAWRTALRTWELMGEVEPQYTDLWARKNISAEPEPSASRRPPRRRLWTAGLSLALAAALAFFLAAPTLMIWLEADFSTQTGESRTVTLADGSQATLSGNSAIGVELTADRRHVRLLSGEAFFDVAHDEKRPFTVEAGMAKVTVLGTAFDVALDEDATTVQLARGVIGISTATANGSVAELAPGEMATIERQGGAINRTKIPLEEIGAWRGGLLFVNDATIDSVVARLQRYSSAWISVPDRTLGKRRVTGLYDLRDADRALRALVQPHGGKVRAVSDYMRVLSRF